MKIPLKSDKNCRRHHHHHQGLEGLDLTAGQPQQKARPLLLLLALLPLLLGMASRTLGGGCWLEKERTVRSTSGWVGWVVFFSFGFDDPKSSFLVLGLGFETVESFC